MFIFSNFLYAIAAIVNMVLNILLLLIIVRAIISWVNPDPYNPIVQLLYKTTEPMLWPIRRILPSSLRFGLDISPMIACLIIIFLRMFLVSTIVGVAARL